MSVKTIYNDLRKYGMTHEGACAMLGNMKAESSMTANIAQRGMTSLSDEAYTRKFDSDPDSCIKDACGYGLCQWTFWSRKSNLWQFAQNWGVSVGSEDMQTAFAVQELKDDFPDLWKYLCTTNALYTAVERICKEFERPAVNNIATRYAFAESFLEELSPHQATVTAPAQKSELKEIADRLEAVLKDLRKYIGGF